MASRQTQVTPSHDSSCYVLPMRFTFNYHSLHHLGKCFVALRAYAPNEQAWVCDFLARVAKPKLLGSAMKRIQLGITDQCSQEQVPYLFLLHIFNNCSSICRGWPSRWPGKAQRRTVFTTPIMYCVHGTKFIWVFTHYALARFPTKRRARLQ